MPVKKPDEFELQQESTMNIDYARQQMIEQQVRAWDVFDDQVLETLADVPRERFVPAGFEPLAFADTCVPLQHGEHMMTPTVEGRVLQALKLSRRDKVLEVGTGSGFLTACLAHMAGHVTSVDIHPDFLSAADSRLADEDVDNVELQECDATQSMPNGEFDAIAVTGSIQTFDRRFVDALRPNGRLFVIVGDAPVMQAQIVVRQDDGDWQTETLFETDVKALTNGALPPQFRF